MFSGLDPAEVTRTADALSHQADALDRIVSRVDALIRTAMHHWSGPEAQDFHQWWVGQHRPRLVAGDRDLRGAASNLRRQVADQVAVSGGAGSATGSSSRAGGGPTSREFLELARHAYDSRPKSFEAGGHTWTPVTAAELRKLGVNPSSMHDPLTGFAATLYRSDDGTYVLSFAGTAHLGAVNDLANDVGGAGGLSLQSAEAIRLAKTLDAHIDGPLTFTGHSLGGRLAAVSAIATGGTATTFNAAGVSDQEFAVALAMGGRDPHAVENVAKNMLMRIPGAALLGDGPDLYEVERRELEDRVTAYYGGADPLTLAQAGTGLPDAVGRQVHVDTHGKVLLDAHNIDGLAPGLPT